MFNKPKEDMMHVKADDLGIGHDPRSMINSENCAYYLMNEVIVDCLVGLHLKIAAWKFEVVFKD